jgi:hypothetical protein
MFLSIHFFGNSPTRDPGFWKGSLERENMVKQKWKKLEKGKVDFLKILGIVNRYYQACGSAQDNSESWEYRAKLVESPPDQMEIFIKKFGKYEYLVHVILGEGLDLGREKDRDTWIHVDGITEERDQFREKGIFDHPVFQIQSLGDIYETEDYPEEEDWNFLPEN